MGARFSREATSPAVRRLGLVLRGGSGCWVEGKVWPLTSALRVFCDRKLGYALRRRCIDPLCGLVDVETGRPRLCSSSFELSLRLFGTTATGTEPVELHLTVYLDEPDLYLKVAVEGRESAARASGLRQLFGRAGRD